VAVDGPFDWVRVFGRAAPRVLDVGCGDGDFLLASAAARPERDHVGIDLLRPVVERASREAKRRGLLNLRFLAGDAVAWLSRQADGSIDEIHVYHPQPYVDPAEVHLGMLSPAFFERMWAVLRRDGRLVLQTDQKAYGRYLLEAVGKHFEPELVPGPWPDAPQGRTRREAVARRKRMRVLRISARRREVPLAVEAPAPYFERPGVRRRRLKKHRGC
jgi:tRNA (guanine-N7-)-methyltransferase